jgi:hypothetical protein
MTHHFEATRSVFFYSFLKEWYIPLLFKSLIKR